MKIRLFIILICSLVASVFAPDCLADSNRQERRLINEGNALYRERRFTDAQKAYQQALKANPSSAEARYNLGLSQIRQVASPADTTPTVKGIVENAPKNFTEVASLSRTKPGLAAKANFNLGNIEFNRQDYAKAIDYYKQALRITPDDEKARKNLRIAQKKLQKQNQDKNNQNNDKDKDKDKNKDQNQDKDKDKNQNQDQKNQDQKNQDQKDKDRQNERQGISQQTASQILQAIDNKESATRARVNKANTGEKAGAASRNNRRW